jgi:hypothetical protein
VPRVLNQRTHGRPAAAVYVGRPSPWGNPFSHLPGTLAQYHVPTRAAAIAAYEAWLLAQPEMVARVKRELAGRDLVCWCYPSACHAEVLLRVANQEMP